MSVDVNLSGIADLIDELERMTVNADRVQGEILDAASEPVFVDAKNTAAFQDVTGYLRKSISKSKPKKKSNRKYILVRAAAPHAHLLEFGTSKMSARPFIQPALERNEREVYEIIKNGLREALGK